MKHNHEKYSVLKKLQNCRVKEKGDFSKHFRNKACSLSSLFIQPILQFSP